MCADNLNNADAISKKTKSLLEQKEAEKEKDFVNLIAEIIVDITLKQAYENVNSISEI